MATVPCMIRGERYLGKGASLYIRWARGDVWSRYKLVACLPHSAELFGPLMSNAYDELEDDPSLTCAGCGTVASDDLVQRVFVTLYLPRTERQDFAVVLCEVCGQRIVELVSTNGVLLPDRETTTPAPASAVGAWEGFLGIEPQNRRSAA